MIVTIEALEQRAAEVLTCALEGGVGYWSLADNIVRDDGRVQSVRLHDASGWDDETPDFQPTTVGADLVLKAIRKLAHPQFLKALGHEDLTEHVRRPRPGGGWPSQALEQKCARLLLGDEDALGEIDADDADCIVQVAAFGGVVYS